MKLSDYLAQNKISDADFAEQVKAHPITVWRWKTGKVKPDWNTLNAIADKTNGDVTANDFVPQESPPEATQ